MTKIQLEDTFETVVVKMSEGNPGALHCIMELMKRTEQIDPQAALGPLCAIFHLDELGIYGSSIYVLWSDQCDKDTRLLISLLRSVQLGFLSGSVVKRVAADQSRTEKLDLSELDSRVCERLQEFQRPPAPVLESEVC